VISTDQYAAEQLEGKSLSTATGTLPLIHLAQVLKARSAAINGERCVITCELPMNIARETGELFETRKDKRRIGLVVDQVLEKKEVLVRNLGRHGGRWYGVAGAAELQDGSVALVLDLPRLLSKLRVESQH
jgi:chemotaxis protein histidine kinase CheA